MTERRKQGQPVELALADSAELIWLLTLSAYPDIETNEAATEGLGLSRQWREDLGASEAELEAHDVRIQTRTEVRELLKTPKS